MKLELFNSLFKTFRENIIIYKKKEISHISP
jgi:hypothetical protein